MVGFDSAESAPEPMGALAGFEMLDGSAEPMGAMAGFDSGGPHLR
jgi:hypothetical protein